MRCSSVQQLFLTAVVLPAALTCFAGDWSGNAAAAAAPSPTAPSHRLEKRVLNGQVISKPFKYPFMSALFYKTDVNGELFLCGGTLLNENWVLTAGQCSFTQSAGNGGPDDWPLCHVETGRFDLSKTVKQENKGRYGVNYQATEPAFFSIEGPLLHDIAVWKLKGHATGPAKVRLNNDTSLNAPGTVATLIGWGRVRETDQDTSSKQREAAIRLLSSSECKRLLPDSEEGPRFDGSYQLCGVSVVKGRGISSGDAGGPLFVYTGRHNTPTVIGIASRVAYLNNDVNDEISIFTKVSRYTKWVEKAIAPKH